MRRPTPIPLLFGFPLVLWPLHIAFFEIVIDPVCSIVFEAEGEEPDTMRRPPRDPAAPLVTPGFVVWALFQGALVFAFVMAVFAVALSRDLPEGEARVLAFAVLVATNVGLVLVNRSTTASVIAAFRQPTHPLVGVGDNRLYSHGDSASKARTGTLPLWAASWR